MNWGLSTIFWIGEKMSYVSLYDPLHTSCFCNVPSSQWRGCITHVCAVCRYPTIATKTTEFQKCPGIVFFPLFLFNSSEVILQVMPINFATGCRKREDSRVCCVKSSMNQIDGNRRC